MHIYIYIYRYIRRAVFAQLCRRVARQRKFYIVKSHLQLLVQVSFAEACFSKFARDFLHLQRGPKTRVFAKCGCTKPNL